MNWNHCDFNNETGALHPKGGTMRRYETIAILDPELSEEGRAPVFDRLTQLIPEQNGFLVKLDEWGARKLAYDIKKKSRGYYVCVDLCGDGALVSEMERFFRIDDRVLKYMTVVLDKDVDLEALKAEIAEAEAEAKAKAEAEAEAQAKAEAEAAAAAEAEAKTEAAPAEALAAEADTSEASAPETVEETTIPTESKKEE
jgi:small subunit ribosomal protein S6